MLIKNITRSTILRTFMVALALVIYSCSANFEKTRRNVSNRYVPYEKMYQIEEYLKEKKISEADQVTGEILLTLANKRKKNWLLSKDIAKLPCPYLIKIDEIWNRQSKSFQGFTRQSKIWREINNKSNELNISLEEQFKNRVKWNDSLVVTPDSAFSNFEGYFPKSIHSEGILKISDIANRLRECQQPN